MMKFKKGDEIKVLIGKDRGKIGKIERVLPKKSKIYVSNINVYKRHVKKYGQIEGGIIDLIKPINISNASLICPNCKKPTRVGLKIEAESKVRICKKCGKQI